MDKGTKSYGKVLSRRELLKLAGKAALGLGIGGSLAACAAPTPTPEVVEVTKIVPATPEVITEVITPTPPELVTIDFWQNWAGILGKAVDRLCKRFDDAQPYVDVNCLVTEVGEHPEKLVTAVAGGNPPDGVTLSADLVVGFVAKDMLLPLDDLIDASEVITRDNYADALWEPLMSEGKTYGVPALENAPRISLGWNKTLFEKAGIDPEKPPTTLEELSAYAEELAEFDAAGNLIQVGFDPLDSMGGGPGLHTWTRAFGAEWYDAEAQKVYLNSPEMVEMVDYIVSFYKKYGPEKMAAFREGYAKWCGRPEASFPRGVQAMILEGYWAPGELAVTAQPGLEFGWTWMPTKTGEKFQLIGGWNISIPKGAKHIDETFKLFEFLSTDDSNLTILEMAGSFCATKSFAEKTDFTGFGGLAWFMESVVKADKVYGNVLCPVFAEARSRLLGGIDEVSFGLRTTQEMLDELQETVQHALDEVV